MGEDGLEYSKHARSFWFWIIIIITIVILLSWGALLFSQIYANILGLIFNVEVFQTSSGFYGITTVSGDIIIAWECTFVWFMVIFTLLALIKHGWKYVIIGNIAVFGLNLLRMILTVYLGIQSFDILALADVFIGLMYIIIMFLILGFMILYSVLK